jgi:ribose transport system substrate-binding protein
MLRGSRKLWVVGCMCTALALAGCGSSSSSTSSSAGTSTSAPTQSAAQKAAAAAIAPYTGKPTAFPVNVPLKSLPKPGFTIDFMDCGTPICALFHSLVAPAAKAIGAKLVDVKAGATASSVNAAFQSVAQQKPNAIINTALDPIEWTQALKTIKAEKIPIITTGVTDGAKYGLTTYPNAVLFGANAFNLDGKLQADWIFAHEGTKAKVLFAWVPELSFSQLILSSFTAQMKKLCPSCEVKPLSIPVADLGTSAPQQIVSALQADPSLNTVTVSNSENLIGLPSAMKTAGLTNITTVGSGAGPVNLQYLKAGQQTVDLAADFPVLSWAMVDAAVRASEGQAIPKTESIGIPVQQFLYPKDITFNPKQGWTGYPNFAKMFLKLWGK